MKKVVITIFILLFTLTACDAGRIFTNPSGIPQGFTPQPTAYEHYDEYIAPQIPVTTTIVTTDADTTLRLSMRHPLTLNPLLNEDVTVARILRLIYEPLIILDENLNPVSHLAELEFTTDFTSALIVLRPDSFWSDGTPVTMADLVFSVEALRNAPQNAIYRNKVANIRHIRRISSRSAQIYFHHASVCVGVSLGFPIIPAHHFRNNMNADPIGNGSFVFEYHSPMRSIRLTQNLSSFRPIAHFTDVEVIFLPDAQTELYAFDQGRIDAIYLPLTEWVRHHTVRHPGYEIFPAMYFEFIGFNFNSEFSNINMRQGIAQVFDACDAIGAVYLHHAQRATTPFHPAGIMAAEVEVLPHDPARARALLYAEPLQRPIIIIANDDNPQRVSTARRLAAELNAIGVHTRAEILPYGEYFARLEEGGFDIFVGGMTLNYPPDIQIFFSGGMFMDCELLKEAYEQARQLHFNEAQYLQALAEFQQTFTDRLPIISLAFRHSAVLTNQRIMQNVAPATGNVLGWVNEWR